METRNSVMFLLQGSSRSLPGPPPENILEYRDTDPSEINDLLTPPLGINADTINNVPVVLRKYFRIQEDICDDWDRHLYSNWNNPPNLPVLQLKKFTLETAAVISSIKTRIYIDYNELTCLICRLKYKTQLHTESISTYPPTRNYRAGGRNWN